MMALSVNSNLSWNPGKGPLCYSQLQELAMSLGAAVPIMYVLPLKSRLSVGQGVPYVGQK